MILKCTYDRDLDSWVMVGEPAGVGGEATLLLSDVRVSADVLDPSRIVEIVVFCDMEGEVSPQSFQYVRLLLGEGFYGFSEGAEIVVDREDLPVFQASRIAQDLALMELENADFELRGLDIVLRAQELGVYARDLVEDWLWTLLPAVAGLGRALQENAGIMDRWTPSAREALSQRASTYLEAIRGRDIESELLEDIECLVLLSAPVPDDASLLAPVPVPPLLPMLAVATRAARDQAPLQGVRRSAAAPMDFDEPGVHSPRLGRHADLFGKGPITLEIGSDSIVTARIPLQAGVSTESLSGVRLRLVERATYQLISEAHLEARVDPDGESFVATAKFLTLVADPNAIILDLSDMSLPVIDRHTRSFVLQHKALLAARNAVVAERNGEGSGSEDLWRVCRQVMQSLGTPTSIINNIDASRRAVQATLSMTPDWLSQLVSGWGQYVGQVISEVQPAEKHRLVLEGALRAVSSGLGEGPTFAVLCQAYATHLVDQFEMPLGEEDNEVVRIVLRRALKLYSIDGDRDRVQQCVGQLSALHGENP